MSTLWTHTVQGVQVSCPLRTHILVTLIHALVAGNPMHHSYYLTNEYINAQQHEACLTRLNSFLVTVAQPLVFDVCATYVPACVFIW